MVSGGLFHGIQLWVNLPADDEVDTRRATRTSRAGEAALVTSPDGGALVRVIAGTVGGHAVPGRPTPRSPWPTPRSSRARAALPWDRDFNALAYVLAGDGYVGAERRPVSTGQLAVFGPGDSVTVGAGGPGSASPNLEVLLLGGRPIREPVAHYGPFVMNTREEIMKAFRDFQKGRLGAVPAERVPHAGASRGVRTT